MKTFGALLLAVVLTACIPERPQEIQYASPDQATLTYALDEGETVYTLASVVAPFESARVVMSGEDLVLVGVSRGDEALDASRACEVDEEFVVCRLGPGVAYTLTVTGDDLDADATVRFVGDPRDYYLTQRQED